MFKAPRSRTRIFVAYSIEMGATQSSALPSKEEILRKTQGGRDIVNQVFDWMVNKTSLRELYALANPEKCKQYIFLTADALDIMFKRIDMEPKEGKKGIIYFQKVEELTRSGSGSADNMKSQQRKVICLKLAFLYVRIFQVFAALALSVLDVDPQADIRLYQELGRFRSVEEETPLFGERSMKKGFLRGGAVAASRTLPTTLEPLRRVVSEVTGDPRYLQIDGLPVYIDVRSMDSYAGFPMRYDYLTKTSGEKRRITARIRAESRNLGDEVILSLSNIRDSEGHDYDNVSLTFKRSADIGSDFKYKRKYNYVQMISKVLEAVRAGRSFREDDLATEKEKDTYNYNEDRVERKRDDYTTGHVSEGLHTESLVRALRQALPPKAHCVARALQLLSDAGLRSTVPSEIYSNVCKIKFLSENRSLPPGNEDITKSIGIYAMAQLFYDTIRGASPEISEATKEQYNAFLMKMKFVFEESSETTLPKGISSIRSKLPSSICDKDRVDHVLKVQNRDVIRLVRAKASQMLNYQITHVANVVSILRKLFLLPVESGKPLQIHPNVRKNGMEEVNKIAQEARTLLIAYYSDCEIMYRQGAEVFGERKDLTKII